jgi:hypothetical protein
MIDLESCRAESVAMTATHGRAQVYSKTTIFAIVFLLKCNSVVFGSVEGVAASQCGSLGKFTD